MANDLISYAFGSSRFKITDFRNGPVSLTGLSIIDVNIKFPGKLFKNPKEDGGFIVDGKIKLPIEVEVMVIIQTVDGAERVNQILKNRDTLYTITSRGVIVESLMCTNQQINLSPEMLSAAPYRLSFRELPLEQTLEIVTKQDADSSIIDKGIAYVKETSQTVTNFATDTISRITSSISGIL